MVLECPRVLEEGVYRYEPGKGWLRGLPGVRGKPVVLVAVNILCRSGCEKVLSMLRRMVGDLVEKGYVRVGLVVCARFRYVCFSDEARQIFTRFNIIASPSVIVFMGEETPSAILKGNMRIEKELPVVLEELRRRVVEHGQEPAAAV